MKSHINWKSTLNSAGFSEYNLSIEFNWIGYLRVNMQISKISLEIRVGFFLQHVSRDWVTQFWWKFAVMSHITYIETIFSGTNKYSVLISKIHSHNMIQRFKQMPSCPQTISCTSRHKQWTVSLKLFWTAVPVSDHRQEWRCLYEKICYFFSRLVLPMSLKYKKSYDKYKAKSTLLSGPLFGGSVGRYRQKDGKSGADRNCRR